VNAAQVIQIDQFIVSGEEVESTSRVVLLRHWATKGKGRTFERTSRTISATVRRGAIFR